MLYHRRSASVPEPPSTALPSCTSTPAGHRPLRPPLRARRLRCRLRRTARQRAHARGHRDGPARAREPRAPRCRGRRPAHRRRRGDPRPDARRVLPRGRRLRAAAGRPVRRRRAASCRRTRRAARSSSSSSSSTSASRASTSSAGATSRSTRTTSATTANRTRPHMRQVFVGAGAGLRGRPGRVRAQALRHPPHRRARRRARTSTPRRSPAAPSSGRGCSSPRSSRGFFPDLQHPALQERARARALALQHEHVPELGARPPVPRDRPQRRDQHAHGQRQLDARPREPSWPPSCSARDLGKIMPIVRPGGVGLGDVRQRPRAAHARAAGRCRTR